MIAADVAGKQPLHPAAEVSVLARPEHEVKMVGHRRDRPGGASGQGATRSFASAIARRERGVVVEFVKHLLPRVAAVQHVVAVIAGGCAGRARHGHEFNRRRRSRKKVECPPFPPPTLRTYEMVCLYLQGWADQQELLAHLEKLKPHVA